MRLMNSRISAGLLGAASWSATEYGLHRFVMHEMCGRGLASVEHLKHHADVTYFSPASKKIASAVSTTAIAYPLAAKATSQRWASAFTSGLIATYFGYEVLHRRTHTHAPSSRFGRWTRRNHLQHHFGAPMRNFGVTTSAWDRVWRTNDEPRVVKVPRRMAPVWLLDEHGNVRAEFADEYTAIGSRGTETAQRERDRIAAFANVLPEA
jgi:Fatty acid hydroxylase superfamily